MFRDRHDAGQQLARRLKDRIFQNPIVLAIPRGGVVLGAVLARELRAELDVVLSRKLRAPFQPELAIGAVSESGDLYLNPYAREALGVDPHYLDEERQYQLGEITRRSELSWKIRPRATVSQRSVIVTDDGIATGSTMIAALQSLKAQHPKEVIVAVPVAPADRLAEIRHWCDELVCLHTPSEFWAIGEFYEHFAPVDDSEVIFILRQSIVAPVETNE